MSKYLKVCDTAKKVLLKGKIKISCLHQTIPFQPMFAFLVIPRTQSTL